MYGFYWLIGQPASKKLDALLAELRKLNVKSQVVTQLDEVACKF